MHWIPLTLLCAFSLASADALTKARMAELAVRDIVAVRFGLAGIAMLPWVLLQPPDWPAPPFWGWILWLVPLEILALVLYMQAIRDHELSLTLPFLAFTPVFVALTGWLILGERVSMQGFAGILLVVAGSGLLHLDRFSWKKIGEAVVAPFRHPGSLRMLAVAVIYALTSVGGKGAMQYMPAHDFGPLYTLMVGMLVLLVFRGTERVPRVIRANPIAAPAAALLMATMMVTHFLALQQVETAYMITVKRTSLLFGILYGAFLFKEPNTPRRLAAGAVMIAGIILIQLSA